MGDVHDAERLRELQALPLQRKILITQTRIIEYILWCQKHGFEPVVSFSGGKDSTVLLHLARKIKPDIKAVFSNTGLEYPELQSFVRHTENVDIIRPKMVFSEVITKYGYPIISKEVAEAIYYSRRIINGERERERERERESSGMPSKEIRTPRTPARKRTELHGMREI